MATTTRKTTKAAPTTTNGTNGATDFTALAEGATQVAELPKTARQATVNPMSELIARSHAEGQPFALPPVSADPAELAKVKAALRRAAARKDLGVSLRHEVVNGQAVITLLGKNKDDTGKGA